jgi:energy-converting hydrogenase Eha subunit E
LAFFYFGVFKMPLLTIILNAARAESVVLALEAAAAAIIVSAIVLGTNHILRLMRDSGGKK